MHLPPSMTHRNRLAAHLVPPPPHPAAQAGLSAAVQLAQQAGGALSDAAHAAVAPLVVFEGSAYVNFAFWAVLLLFTYNLIVLAPRQ
jgi:hypothetical protein